jgi:hypothetical protein
VLFTKKGLKKKDLKRVKRTREIIARNELRKSIEKREKKVTKVKETINDLIREEKRSPTNSPLFLEL